MLWAGVPQSSWQMGKAPEKVKSPHPGIDLEKREGGYSRQKDKASTTTSIRSASAREGDGVTGETQV